MNMYLIIIMTKMRMDVIWIYILKRCDTDPIRTIPFSIHINKYTNAIRIKTTLKST